VTHCRATRSHGFLAGACTNMLFEYCRAYSCGYGIFTSAGHHNRAYRCYVNDTTEIGVFLYNGPDNVIEECYVHDTGREGIGTNGDCRRHAYRNNVVYNCGWNGINMEGNGLDHVIEGNLVANTHYGILSMGGNGVVRNNRTFMCTQNGLLLLNASGDTVESNLVVESHQDGIWVYNGCSDVTIRGNTIIGAGIGVKLESAGSAGRCRVVGNTFSRFLSGVSLGAAGGQEAVVEGNTFIGGRNGIVGGKGPGVRIAGNRLVHTLNGMSLGEPQDARIVSNRFRSVGMPLVLASGRGCVVEGNESTMSYYHGFYLTEPSGCTVRGNAILGSRTQGIRLDGGSSNVLSANRIVSAGGRGASDTGGIVLKKTTGAVLEANEIEDANVAIRFREGCRGVRLAGNRYRGGGLNVQIPAFEKPDNALDTEVSVEVIPDDKRAANELPPVPGRE
jgi:parallel beta-helix repeat protein